MNKIVIKILQRSVVKQNVLGGLAIYRTLLLQSSYSMYGPNFVKIGWQ